MPLARSLVFRETLLMFTPPAFLDLSLSNTKRFRSKSSAFVALIFQMDKIYYSKKNLVPTVCTLAPSIPSISRHVRHFAIGYMSTPPQKQRYRNRFPPNLHIWRPTHPVPLSRLPRLGRKASHRHHTHAIVALIGISSRRQHCHDGRCAHDAAIHFLSQLGQALCRRIDLRRAQLDFE